MLEENIENAIHRIAVHLHRRLGEGLALHGIDQSMHETRSSTHGEHGSTERRVRVGKRQVDGADAAFIKQVDEPGKQALALRDWNVLKNNEGMNQVETVWIEAVHFFDQQQPSIPDAWLGAILFCLRQHARGNVDTNGGLDATGKWDEKPADATTKVEKPVRAKFWPQLGLNDRINVFDVALSGQEELVAGLVVQIRI